MANETDTLTARGDQAAEVTKQDNSETTENSLSDDVEGIHATWGELCVAIGVHFKEKTALDWLKSFGLFVALLTSLYFFLFSLDLMGTAFKVIGGCSAGGLFGNVTNPIAGLVVGVLATVLVQSSSTSTSIVVSLVGADQMSVSTAIPVIMGANIGTSVTNTIVSMGQLRDGDQLEKAFAGATVHDMFNFLAVFVLLPIEAATGFLQALTGAMTPPEVRDGEKWVGPIKIIVSPLVKVFISANKDFIKDLSKGATCAGLYEDVVNGDEKGLIKSGLFFTKHATQEEDTSAGWVVLIISLILLVTCLFALVSVLQRLIAGTSERMLKRATTLNGYVSMAVGAVITVLVQSSSITTSVLTPLVGLGVVSLEQMFPLTLGANIGTTVTALLASLVSSKPTSVQVAYCHLCFNLIGIIIWYPIPFMRRVPLNAARALGAATRRSKSVPLLYIFVMFVVVPIILLGLSTLFESGKSLAVLGTIITMVLLFALAKAIYWWVRKDGKKTTLEYLDQRGQRQEALKTLPSTLKLLEERIRVLEGGDKEVLEGVDKEGAGQSEIELQNVAAVLKE